MACIDVTVDLERVGLYPLVIRQLLRTRTIVIANSESEMVQWRLPCTGCNNRLYITLLVGAVEHTEHIFDIHSVTVYFRPGLLVNLERL